MIKIRLLAPAGSYSRNYQSIGRYSQMFQKRKKRFLCDDFLLLWQTGEGVTWLGWMDCGIQINQLGIPYPQRERRRVYKKLSPGRRCFEVFLSSAYNCNMTVAIVRIRAKFAREAFEFSLHTTDRTILRGICVNETREAIQTGKIIEDYPDDK